MQFTFPEEQQAFADSVRRFALAKLAPDALKRAHDPRYPFDVAQLMSAQGSSILPITRYPLPITSYARNSGRSFRMLDTFSRAQTVSHRRRARGLPRIGAIR